jgi:amino acid permease
VELVALAAGESKDPHRSVPRAIKATFFRIVIFYIMTVLVLGLCINRTDPTFAYGKFHLRILRCSWLTFTLGSDGGASPFTAVFVRAGFGAAAHVVNAVLLTAVLSATNSCFYGSSRMLLSLARSGHAPAFFGWVNRRGVPVPALT